MPGKIAGHDFVDRLVERRALIGIREQPPERGEGLPCLAVGDHVHPGEQGLQHFPATGVVVHQPFAQVAIELFEAVAHAAEIAG